MTDIITLAKQAGLELDLFDDNFAVLHGKLITLEQLIRADERELNLRTAEDFDTGAEAAAAIDALRAALDAPEREPLSDARIISLAYDCNAMPESCTDESLKLFARAVEQEVRGR